MTITTAQRDEVRDWVGDTDPSDADIDAKFLVEGTVASTALSFLKRRRANLLQDPETWKGPDYSESWGKTLDALSALIKLAEGAVYTDECGASASLPGAPYVQPVDFGRQDRDRLFG